MGATYVTVTVSNLRQPDRAWVGEFRVDTGVHHSRIPRKHLEAIGIEPEGSRDFLLADGAEATFDTGCACLDFMDEKTWVTVLFDTDNAEPVLGQIAMTSAALRFDPETRRFERRPRILNPRRPVTRGRRKGAADGLERHDSDGG